MGGLLLFGELATEEGVELVEVDIGATFFLLGRDSCELLVMVELSENLLDTQDLCVGASE